MSETAGLPEVQEGQEPPEPPTSGPKEFPCKQCGAKLQYAPGTRAQKCTYCGSENQIAQSEADIHELDFGTYLRQMADQRDTVERLTVKCSACGAASTLEPNVTSAKCPFCDSPVVATGTSERLLKPQSLLPFKITRDQAQGCFRNWVSSLWFAPGDLKKYAESESKLAGMYVPYWTYDTKTMTFYRGERGDDYTVTVGTGKNRHTERRTRWRSVSGTVWVNFDDVLVIASNALPRNYAEKLEPWDLKSLETYNDDFLAGFRAESYQVDLQQGFTRAKEIMAGPIREKICRDIGGDHQRIHSSHTQYDNITFKHLLLPIWLSAYRYQEKVYRFLVNGRTGEVQGERPWSWIKITLAALAGIGIVGTLIVLLAATH
jgi:DNA-directed RNA polymerase subunit RPC12/RpoP